MKEIFFVDDEPNVLDGLRRMLGLHRNEWNMHFATDGESALAMMNSDPPDIVVSDMRMPGMDGVTLLTHVRSQHPLATRIVLSGQADARDTIRSIPIAHQFLSKPCSPERLQDALRRSVELQEQLVNSKARALIGAVDVLPSPSGTVNAFNEQLASPDMNLDDLVRVVEADVAVAARLLQVANSAFFGLGREVRSVHRAVQYLGIATVRDIATTVGLFSTLRDQSEEVARHLLWLEARSIDIAHLAVNLLTDWAEIADAYTGALLHDIGDLVVAVVKPECLLQIAERVVESRTQSRTEIEIELLGASHAEIGAYLLSLWGLPYPLIEIVARHHDAYLLANRHMNAVHAVHIAHQLMTYPGHNVDDLFPAGYLEDLHIADQVRELKHQPA